MIDTAGRKLWRLNGDVAESVRSHGIMSDCGVFSALVPGDLLVFVGTEEGPTWMPFMHRLSQRTALSNSVEAVD